MAFSIYLEFIEYHHIYLKRKKKEQAIHIVKKVHDTA